MKCGFNAKAKWSTFTGMAGNYRVASELLLRGFNVSLPAVDSGVDIYVEGVVRIQVKSAHAMRHESATRQASYNFNLARGPKALGGGIATKSTPRVFSDKCDFLILWGIEQNRFWIVPAQLLDNRMTVYLGPDGRWLPTSVEQIERMLASGMTQRAIARMLHVSEMTISRRVNKIFDHPGVVVAHLSKIRACESQWDQIQQYLDTMQEATDVVDAVASEEVTPRLP